MKNIPKHIIQFWHDKKTLPLVYKEAMAENKLLHPDFKFFYIDDNFIHALLKNKFGRCLLELYENNTIPASRSDIARLVALYEFGGIYMDVSIVLKQSLNTLLENTNNIEVILLARDDMPQYQDYPEKAHLWNGMIISTPKSNFIADSLSVLILNLLSGRFNNDVLAATGPKVLNAILCDKDYAIKKLSFKELKVGFLIHLQNSHRQSWVLLQEKGIINHELIVLIYNRHTNSNKFIYYKYGYLSLFWTKLYNLFSSLLGRVIK